MVKQTFSQDSVADAMNKNFVPLKMEMEHDFGKKIAMKYGVSGFPTYLIFNPDGKLVYKAVGYMEAKDFLAKLDEARDPAKQKIATGISEKVDLNFPDFYVGAFNENGKRKFPDSTTLANYFDQQQNLLSEVNYDVLSRFAYMLSPKYQQYFLDNRAKYAALYTQEAVKDMISSIAYQRLQAAINSKSEEKLNSVLSFIDLYFDDKKDKEDYRVYYSITFYQSVGDWQKFAGYVDQFIAANGYDNDNTINEWGWAVYEKCDDPAIVAKAVGWMKPVIDTKPKYFSMDTYAALLYKAKKYNEADTYARKAIVMGRKEGQKIEGTQILLDKIEKEK